MACHICSGAWCTATSVIRRMVENSPFLQGNGDEKVNVQPCMYLIFGPHSRREFALTLTLLWATIIAQIHQAQSAVGRVLARHWIVVGGLGIKNAIFIVRRCFYTQNTQFSMFFFKCCGGRRIRVLGTAAQRRPPWAEPCVGDSGRPVNSVFNKRT